MLEGLMEILRDERRRSFQELRVRRAARVTPSHAAAEKVLRRHWGGPSLVPCCMEVSAAPPRAARRLHARLAAEEPRFRASRPVPSPASPASAVVESVEPVARKTSISEAETHAPGEVDSFQGDKVVVQVVATVPAVRPPATPVPAVPDLDSRWDDLIQRMASSEKSPASRRGSAGSMDTPPSSARSARSLGIGQERVACLQSLWANQRPKLLAGTWARHGAHRISFALPGCKPMDERDHREEPDADASIDLGSQTPSPTFPGEGC